jgi:hypothetical protein
MSNVNLSKKPSTHGHTVVGGGGSVLLCKGGTGGASAYDGIEDYERTTGRKIKKTSGSGLGLGLGLGVGSSKSELNKKLESLSFTPKPKQKNISFNL